MSRKTGKFTSWRYLNYYSQQDLIPNVVKFTNTGAMRSEPKQTKFGLIKVFLLTVPAGLFGAFLSNKGAEVLEESELFVPDD